MKTLFLTTLFSLLLLNNSLMGQELYNVDLTDKGVLTLHSTYNNSVSPQTIYQDCINWVRANSNDLKAKITYHSALKGDVIINGHILISLGNKRTPYQTRMFFTMHIHIDKQQTTAKVNNIYYRSLPQYGKQGTPSLITYSSDWLSAHRLFRKDGSERWLNAQYKNSTIESCSNLLASLQDILHPTL